MEGKKKLIALPDRTSFHYRPERYLPSYQIMADSYHKKGQVTKTLAGNAADKFPYPGGAKIFRDICNKSYYNFVY